MLPGGTYLFDAVIDGTETRSTCIVHTPPSSSDACNDRRWSFESNAGGVIAFWFGTEGAPKSIPVSVTLPDGRVVSKTSTPTYADFQPNGPSCDPTCHVADETMTIGP